MRSHQKLELPNQTSKRYILLQNANNMRRITLSGMIFLFGSKYALSFFQFMTHPLRNYELSKAGWLTIFLFRIQSLSSHSFF